MSKRSSAADTLSPSFLTSAALELVSPTDASPQGNVSGSHAPSKRTRSTVATAAATASAPPGGKTLPLIEVPKHVTFSIKESAPQLFLSRDLMEVTGCRAGYRMAKGSDCVYTGNWYWECEILEDARTVTAATAGDRQSEERAEEDCPHFRVGWATKQGNLQAPVGYDKHSFGYRDVAGSKIHKCERVDYYGEAYGPGDVVGCMICLPILPEHMRETALNVGGNSVQAPGFPPPFLPREEVGVSTTSVVGGVGVIGVAGVAGSASYGRQGGRKGSGPDEDACEDPLLQRELDALGNHIRFFKNGKDQGPAYTQIPGARYYPAVSLYLAGRVRGNFGPSLICPPQTSIPFSPVAALKGGLKRDELALHNQAVNERRAALAARRQRQEATEHQEGGRLVGERHQQVVGVKEVREEAGNTDERGGEEREGGPAGRVAGHNS